MLVLGTVLAGSAHADPVASVECGTQPDHTITVYDDGEDYKVGPVTVYDMPHSTSNCPLT